jgi:hypothetical protein
MRVRRRCASLKTMTWSKYSRRMQPIKRSTAGFCQGARGVVSQFRAQALDPVRKLCPIPIFDSLRT